MFGEEQPQKSRTSGPIAGLAISVCLFVVAIMISISTLCGSGMNGGGSQVSAPLILFTLGAPVVGFFGCLIWLAVVLVQSYGKK